MNGLLRDLRYAARALARTPLFTIGIVVTLALGIGVNATMFGVVDRLFFKPPAGVRQPDQVRRIYFRRDNGAMGVSTYPGTSFPAYGDMLSVPGFATASAVASRGFSIGRGRDAAKVVGAAVTHEYFPMLGLSPALGRFFGSDEDSAAGQRVAVVSYAYWQRRFGGKPDVLGQTLPIGHGAYTIIGVAPRGFTGIELQPVDLWLPMRVAGPEIVPGDAMTSRNWSWLNIIVRLKDGANEQVAADQATAAYRHAQSEGRSYPDTTTAVVLGPIQAARGPGVDDDARVSAWVGFVSLAVLLIACANVANLLLARSTNRRRELALRAGLGAGRGGLMRMLLSESLVLAVVGGAAALLLATWFGSLVGNFLLPDLPAEAQLVDARVLVFTAGAVVLTALLAGLVPAWQASRADVAEALKAGGHGATARTGRTRSVLLMAQVALTLVLLVGAGLFVRSLRNVQSIDTGFDMDRVLYVQVDLDALGGTRDANNQAYLDLMARLQNLPGVEYATAAMGTPFNWSYATTISAQDVDSIPDRSEGGPYYSAVTTDYFKAMGLRVVRGRDFSTADVDGAPKVAIVNETFARILWQGKEAVGKCLYLGEDADPKHRVCTTVIGVAEDAKRGEIVEHESFQYYLPFAQFPHSHINALLIRSRTRANDIAGAVRREIAGVSTLPYAYVESLQDVAAPQLRSWTLGATAFSAFGALALVIAATGIVSVLSYSVSQRTQEIGVRVALGAQAGQVVRLIVGQGMRATVLGLVVGSAGAYALGRAMTTLLYQVAPSDPLVFSGVAAVLGLVALVASYLPARRAASVNPIVALRAE